VVLQELLPSLDIFLQLLPELLFLEFFLPQLLPRKHLLSVQQG
jgi:hypothetical protein